jgi:hypothetical protein
LFGVGDVETLAGQIDLLAGNPFELKRLGEASRLRMATGFARKDVVEKYLESYMQ